MITVETYHQKDDPRESPLWLEMQSDPAGYQKGFTLHALLVIPQIYALIGVSQVFPGAFRYLIGAYQNHRFHDSSDSRSFAKIGAEVIRRTKENPAWINDYTGEFWQLTERFKRQADQFFLTFKSYDSEQLASVLSALINESIKPQSYAYLTDAFGDHGWITDYIRELYPAVTDRDLNALLEPTTRSFVQVFSENLHNAESEEEFGAVLENFYWVKGSYFSTPLLDLDKLREEKEKLHDTKKDYQALVIEKKAIIEKASDPEALNAFVQVIEKAIAMQDERKANVLRLNYCLAKIADQIVNINPEWSKEELLASTPHEALRILKGNLSSSYHQILEDRVTKSAWIFDQESYYLTNDPLVVEQVFAVLDQDSGKQLKGHIAYPGVVEGTVRIILSENDFHKMQEGDILVTWMTRPEFLPVIKKASAIITNEGGITSHAAIIARELKKPCVIATKTATKVLKDGDLVEVDAKKGIVTRL